MSERQEGWVCSIAANAEGRVSDQNADNRVFSLTFGPIDLKRGCIEIPSNQMRASSRFRLSAWQWSYQASFMRSLPAYQRATVQWRVDSPSNTGGMAVALREDFGDVVGAGAWRRGCELVRSCGEEIQTRLVLNVAYSQLSETLRALNKTEPERLFQHDDISLSVYQTMYKILCTLGNEPPS